MGTQIQDAASLTPSNVAVIRTNAQGARLGAPVELSELFLGVLVDDVRLLSLVVRDGHDAPRRRRAELQREADGLVVRLIAHQESACQLALPWEQGKTSQA